MRAGLPSVAVPGIMDQPFWARRLHHLGVSPPSLARTALTADDLAAAITTVVTDPSHGRNAQDLAARIGAEDGPRHAVEVIERLLDGYETPTTR